MEKPVLVPSTRFAVSVLDGNKLKASAGGTSGFHTAHSEHVRRQETATPRQPGVTDCLPGADTSRPEYDDERLRAVTGQPSTAPHRRTVCPRCLSSECARGHPHCSRHAPPEAVLLIGSPALGALAEPHGAVLCLLDVQQAVHRVRELAAGSLSITRMSSQSQVYDFIAHEPPCEESAEAGSFATGGVGRALTVICWPSIVTDTPCGSLIGTLPMRLSFGVSCFRATHWKGRRRSGAGQLCSVRR